MSQAYGMVAVLSALCGLIAVLYVARRRTSLHPELVRKLLHIGMGLVSLALPFLFEDSWPVLVLVAGATLLMLALRVSPGLRRRLGGIVHDVSRQSFGELYFPLAVGVLFLLAHGRPILFCIPILILTLADALSALAGIRYGQVKYRTAEGEKSLEGSTVFFTVTFLSTHIPLLLLTDTGRAESLLIAAILGLLVMLLEAIAWRGLDNLFIPLGGFVLLKIYLGLPVAALVGRLLVVLLLVAFVLLLRRHTTLIDNALLAGALYGYAAWTLGGWRWLAPALLLFVAYPLLSPKTPTNVRRVHDLHAVASVTGAGLFWLFLAHALERGELFYPYVITFAAQLAIIGIARMRHDFPLMSSALLVAICSGKGWLLLLSFVWLEGWNRQAWLLAGAAGVAVLIGALSFFFLQPSLENCPRDAPRWLRQAASAGAASVVGLIPLYLLPG